MDKRKQFIIISIILLIVLFAILIYLNFYSIFSYKEKKALVVKIECLKILDENNNRLCTYHIKYKADNEIIDLELNNQPLNLETELKKELNINNEEPKKIIKIKYNPDNPREVIVINSNDFIDISVKKIIYNVCLYLLIISVIVMIIILIKNK